MSEPIEVRAGMLLLATPELVDPNFADTVVLLLDVDEDGVLGVVLNQPSAIAVRDVLDGWSDRVTEPAVLFRGGPVGPDAAIAVALLRDAAEAPVGFKPVHGRLGLLDLDTPTELVADGLSALRLFAGYAGWGAGQLQGEIVEGSWYVLDAVAEDIFRHETGALWRDVLRRQPGDLAFHSTRPADPQLN